MVSIEILLSGNRSVNRSLNSVIQQIKIIAEEEYYVLWRFNTDKFCARYKIKFTPFSKGVNFILFRMSIRVVFEVTREIVK